MDGFPLISIIIPTFNRVLLLAETLDSILNQVYVNWECLVIDDGSTDGTEDLLHTFNKVDSRFKYFKRPLSKIRGASTCRNMGLTLAKGGYVMFFDSDDILLPKVLSLRMQEVLNNPGYDFYVFQTAQFFKKIGDGESLWNDLTKPNYADLEDFLNINPVWHTSGPIWNKEFLSSNELRFTEGIHSWQDWEFHIRVLLFSPRYLKMSIVDTLVYQRFHENSAINKLNSPETLQNRIGLLFSLIHNFKVQARFDDVKVQKQFFKLFYFIIHKMPYEYLDKMIWKRVEEELYLVPKVDMWFWKHYAHFNDRYQFKSSYTIYELLKRLKKQFFNKRFAVDDFSKRTWYQIKQA